jgi:GNAT superfamily N-acetyltransferase
MIHVLSLSPEHLQGVLPELMALDRVVRGEMGLSYSHEDWRERQFGIDLPGKWQLSQLALASDGKVAGFWIASAKQGWVHTHRVAVDRRYRGSGTGRQLFSAVESQARRSNHFGITLSLAAENLPALLFYQKLGFSQLVGTDLKEFVEASGRVGRIVAGQRICEDVAANCHAEYIILKLSF